MKVVIVTGGTRGLGLAICQRVLTDGFRVVAIGRNQNPEFKALLKTYPENLAFEAFDFNDLKSIHEFSRHLVDSYGRPFGLVNNAALGHDGVLATLHEKNISELVRVNIEAPVLLTKYLLRPMLLNRSGRIINISSIMADTGYSGLSVYGASKAAAVGFTRSLAREVGKAGITVNAVAPGYMDTDMTGSLQGDKLQTIVRRSPLGRLVSVDDVAAGVSYLLGDSASSVTGSTLTIDAGTTA